MLSLPLWDFRSKTHGIKPATTLPETWRPHWSKKLRNTTWMWTINSSCYSLTTNHIARTLKANICSLLSIALSGELSSPHIGWRHGDVVWIVALCNIIFSDSCLTECCRRWTAARCTTSARRAWSASTGSARSWWCPGFAAGSSTRMTVGTTLCSRSARARSLRILSRRNSTSKNSRRSKSVGDSCACSSSKLHIRTCGESAWKNRMLELKWSWGWVLTTPSMTYQLYHNPWDFSSKPLHEIFITMHD